LQKEIELDQIPIEYGGRCRTHGRKCITGGGTFIYGDPSRKPEEELTVNVKAGEKHFVEIEAKEDNTTVYWNFIATPSDIGFSVSRSMSKGQVDICGYFKYDGDKLHENHIIVPKGKYTLVWDNTYSMFRGKTVKYRVEVVNGAAEAM
jgi:hypothetical protein